MGENKGCFEEIGNRIYGEWARRYMWAMVTLGGLSVANAGLVGMLFWKSTKQKGFWNKVKELEVNQDEK